MIDGIFVFDCVIHLHDMSNENLNPHRSDSTHVRNMQVGMGEMLRPIHGGDLDYATRTSVEDMYRLVFEESPTDMAMAQVVPVFDWYPDFWAPVALQHAMAAAYPDKVLLRFTGMCTACAWKTLTWFGTVKDAIEAVPGVARVVTTKTRVSEQAEARFRALRS